MRVPAPGCAWRAPCLPPWLPRGWWACTRPLHSRCAPRTDRTPPAAGQGHSRNSPLQTERETIRSVMSENKSCKRSVGFQNQDKALVDAFSVIVITIVCSSTFATRAAPACEVIVTSVNNIKQLYICRDQPFPHLFASSFDAGKNHIRFSFDAVK